MTTPDELHKWAEDFQAKTALDELRRIACTEPANYHARTIARILANHLEEHADFEHDNPAALVDVGKILRERDEARAMYEVRVRENEELMMEDEELERELESIRKKRDALAERLREAEARAEEMEIRLRQATALLCDLHRQEKVAILPPAFMKAVNFFLASPAPPAALAGEEE